MRLQNVNLLNKSETVDIIIKNGLIAQIELARESTFSKNLPVIEFSDALAFPGLINSHDHLDFNLFPQFDGPVYNNYTEWGTDIHKRYKQQINGVLQVPLHLRTAWGVYKNLLCGITTVVNHGNRLAIQSDLVNIIQSSHNLHSVQFEQRWKVKLNNPFKMDHPYVIHAGEGTDDLSYREIDELLKWNIFKKQLIGIHGVAMHPHQAKGFKALVWCPETNYFLLRRTADISRLKQHTEILFGTDSTLTANWNIWQHLRLALNTGHLSEEELLKSLTANAARIWRLNSGEIETEKAADIVVAKKPKSEFFDLNPTDLLLVMHKGNIRLFDECIYNQLKLQNLLSSTYCKINFGSSVKYVQGNLAELIAQIKSFYPRAGFPVTSVTADQYEIY